MARQPRHRYIRNLRSSGWEAAKFTRKTLNKTAAGLFRLLSTDHSGMSEMFTLMPKMGFLDSIKYVFMCFLRLIVCPARLLVFYFVR